MEDSFPLWERRNFIHLREGRRKRNVDSSDVKAEWSTTRLGTYRT